MKNLFERADSIQITFLNSFFIYLYPKTFQLSSNPLIKALRKCVLLVNWQFAGIIIYMLYVNQDLFGRKSAWKYQDLLGIFLLFPYVCMRGPLTVSRFYVVLNEAYWAVETWLVKITAPPASHVYMHFNIYFSKGYIYFILHGLFYQYYLLDHYFSSLTSFMETSQWLWRAPSDPCPHSFIFHDRTNGHKVTCVRALNSCPQYV